MKKIPDEVFNEVKEIYLKQINIPQVKPEIQYLLCPIGLVGAGKTTVIKPLAEKLDLIRISGDEIRKILKNEGFGYDQVREIIFGIIKKFLVDGFSVAIDSDCIAEETQVVIKEAEKQLGIKIIWIHIHPSGKFILHKLKNLKPNWLGTPEEMVSNYYRRKPLHKDIDFPFVYTFDTSKDNLDEQIEEASKIISSNSNQ